MIMSFLGMCLFEFVIGKIFDVIAETAVSEEISPRTVCLLGQPFAGALR